MSKVSYEIEGKEYVVADTTPSAVLLQNTTRPSDKRIVSVPEFCQARMIIRHEENFGSCARVTQ